MRPSDLRRHLAIILREHQLFRREPAFWGIALLASALVFWRSASAGTSAALAAYHTWQIAVLGLAVVAILMAGTAAARDRRHGVSELVLAKPGGSDSLLALDRFLPLWLSLLAVVVVMLGCSSLAQILFGGTPWRPQPYLDALLYSALPLGLAAALGYSLSSFFGTPLASAVAAVYWIAIPVATAYLPSVLDLTTSQHWALCALLGAGLIVLACWLHARAIRDPKQRQSIGAWAAVLLFAATGIAGRAFTAQGEDALLEPDPILSAVAGQTALEGERAPGFWLPDHEGRLVGLADFADRPLLIAFWGPASPPSVQTLPALSRLVEEFQDERLACAAICLDRDAHAVRHFAPQDGDGLVVLWDRGRHFGDGLPWSDSPVAVAYDISEVPTVFLVDSQRRMRAVFRGEFEPDRVRRAIIGMLSAE